MRPIPTPSGRLRGFTRHRSSHERRQRESTSGRLTRPLILFTGLLVAMAGLFFAFILVSIQATAAAYAALTNDLPSLSAISNHASFKTAQIFDRRGQLLWEFYDPDGGMRTVVPLSEMSQHLIDATLAAEDAYYYQHQGVDLRATVRSTLLLASSGENRGGASTITQQLVRNVIMDPEEAQQVTPERKLREIILAYRLDDQYSKDQILEMYLNEVFLGNQSYGVEAAAQNYFDKHARDLTLAEASMIAGLVQSPSAYDPTRRDLPRTADGIPLPTKERQAYVLEQMTRHGFITEDQARAAYAEPLKIKQRHVELKAPHWVMYIRDLVEQKYGPRVLYQGGLKIYTTLDLDYSEKMREVLLNSRDNITSHGGDNAALIAVNPKTGEILAFDGSLDYHDDSIDGQVNILTSERQPGSSIKPLVYSEAFQKGWAPGTLVDDVRTCWEDAPGRQWCPKNFDNIFHGQTTARSALGNSLNIPAVKALEYAGVDQVVDLGRKMGINSWASDSGKHFGLSLTLGGAEVAPIELAQMYATFANNGLKIPLVAITRIVDAEGKVLEDYKVPQGEQVIDPRAAYMITDILSDPNAKLFTYGQNTPLVLRREGQIVPAASKTGTTDNNRDTWTAGYTPNLAIAVWVGNTSGAPMREVLSSMTAGKIWPEAMQASIDYFHLPLDPFPRPNGLAEQQVCGDTRMRPGAPLCRQDLFYQDRVPKAPVGAVPTRAPAPRATPTPAGEPTPSAQQKPEPTPQPKPEQPAQPKPEPTTQPAPTRPPPPAQPTPTPAPKPQTKPQAKPGN